MATILVIEDEHAIRTTVATCLRYSGHTVVEARNGREGLQCHAYGAGAFDLVICDLILPDIDGIETIRTLHERAANLPILAISGALHALAYLSSRINTAGRAYLAKPFKPRELVTAVEGLLSETHQNLVRER